MDALEQAAYHLVQQGDATPQRWYNIIARAEQGAIKAALDLCHGNQTEAAERLGLNRNTFRERIGRYGLRGYALKPIH